MKVIILISLIYFNNLNIFAQKKGYAKSIEISINPNMETFAIVERLALPYTNYLKFRDSALKVDKVIRPMVYYAYEHFKNQDNSKIAKHYAAVFDTIVNTKAIGVDVIYGALVCRENFPKKGSIAFFKLDNQNVSKETNAYIDKEIALLIEEMRQFYIDRDVAGFMKKYNFFYNGAMDEVKKAIPNNILTATANYYRNKDDNQYAIYLVPSRAFLKGEWQANGPTIALKNGKKKYVEILNCAYDEVALKANKKYTHFGYGDYEFLTQLTIHEFGHSFVAWGNTEIEYTKKSTALFDGELKIGMRNLGVGTWETCVNEHIVRTSEIRIAEKMGDKKRADFLRDSYIKKKHFIFIPMLENKFLEYENNANKYPSFKSFLQEVIAVFDNIKIEERDKLLNEFKK
jgi:hypothetical protein